MTDKWEVVSKCPTCRCPIYGRIINDCPETKRSCECVFVVYSITYPPDPNHPWVVMCSSKTNPVAPLTVGECVQPLTVGAKT